MSPSAGQEAVRISEASKRTGLPESTIRYYDREFSQYLSIPRGENNERLFEQDHLRDLEYIRYLIKREGLSVKEVRERLREEQPFESSRDSEESPQTSPDRFREAPPESSGNQWERLNQKVDAIEQRLEQIEEKQESIRNLLDMNLKRYNEIIDALSL